MLDIFKQRLQEARKKKNYTIKGLALQSGVSATAIYSYENGWRNPSLINATNIADVLGVSLDWLTGRERR